MWFDKIVIDIIDDIISIRHSTSIQQLINISYKWELFFFFFFFFLILVF